ncbi:MAG: hypothetical protein PVH91_13880 [Pseudomonadales bacterium]|jgi:hypothetical protein
MQGGSVPEPERRYLSSQDNAARFIVYYGPYLFWGSLGALLGLLFLIAR